MTPLLLALAVLLNGQARVRPSQPDFSGEWVLMGVTDGAVDVATELIVRQPVQSETVRGTSMPAAYLQLIVERQRPTGVQSTTYRIGIESGFVGGSVQTRQPVRWVGDTLVISTSRWSGTPGDQHAEAEREEIWRLDNDGRLVITTSEREGLRESTTTLTYRRR